MNANYCRKKLLAIVFFSTAKHFIIKKNNFTNHPFLSANEKEQYQDCSLDIFEKLQLLKTSKGSV